MRMGRDKAFLVRAGQPLLATQLTKLRAAGAEEVLISGRPDTKYEAFGCPVLQDRFLGAGPLAGIERGLATVRAPLLLVMAVDLPCVNVEFLHQLLARCEPERGVVPLYQDRLEPLLAVYPRRAHPWAVTQLEQGERAVHRFAEQCRREGAVIFWPIPPGAGSNLKNCNAPEDWAGLAEPEAVNGATDQSVARPALGPEVRGSVGDEAGGRPGL